MWPSGVFNNFFTHYTGRVVWNRGSPKKWLLSTLSQHAGWYEGDLKLWICVQTITLVSFTLGTWHWSHSSESKETSSVVAGLQTSWDKNLQLDLDIAGIVQLIIHDIKLIELTVSLFRRASCSGPMHRVSQYIATASPEHWKEYLQYFPVHSLSVCLYLFVAPAPTFASNNFHSDSPTEFLAQLDRIKGLSGQNDLCCQNQNHTKMKNLSHSYKL